MGGICFCDVVGFGSLDLVFCFVGSTIRLACDRRRGIGLEQGCAGEGPW